MNQGRSQKIRNDVAMKMFPPEGDKVYSKKDRRDIYKETGKVYRAAKKNYVANRRRVVSVTPV